MLLARAEVQLALQAAQAILALLLLLTEIDVLALQVLVHHDLLFGARVDIFTDGVAKGLLVCEESKLVALRPDYDGSRYRFLLQLFRAVPAVHSV